MGKLGVRPIDFSLRTSNSDFRVIRINKQLTKLYKTLKRYNLVGVISDRSNGSGRVYERNDERSYLLVPNKAISIEPNHEASSILMNLIIVKKWSEAYQNFALREMKNLEAVNKHRLQVPSTIPLYLARNQSSGELQLFKVREPVVRFNDLHRILSENDNKKEIFSRYSLECLENWANLAKHDYIQTSMLKLDHTGSEEWVHDEDDPGIITGGVDEPCNAGFIKHNGEERCIINDAEHIYNRSEIFDLPHPHDEPTYGNKFTCKIGTVIASLFIMLSRTADLLRLPSNYVERTINNALVHCYNTHYDRDREEGFKFVKDAMKEVFRFRKKGSISPDNITKISDQFYAPLLFEDSLDHFFNGILDEDVKKKVLEDFTRGAEISWPNADRSMTNVIDLMLHHLPNVDPEDPDDFDRVRSELKSLLPEGTQKFIQKTLYHISGLVKEDPKKTEKLSNKILNKARKNA